MLIIQNTLLTSLKKSLVLELLRFSKCSSSTRIRTSTSASSRAARP